MTEQTFEEKFPEIIILSYPVKILFELLKSEKIDWDNGKESNDRYVEIKKVERYCLDKQKMKDAIKKILSKCQPFPTLLECDLLKELNLE